MFSYSNLRIFPLSVSAHHFCACTLRHASNKMNNDKATQMAISIALPEYNDLGRLVTPIIRLMDHFLYEFSMLSEKMKKIYRLQFS